MIIGSIRAKEKDGTVYIGKLMVHPDYRCKGYGSRMLNEIEAYKGTYRKSDQYVPWFKTERSETFGFYSI